MASLDDVVSNLKNVVTNLSGLAAGTGIINSISTLTLAVNAIGSTLSTAHIFAGTITFVTNQFSAVVAQPKVVSNSVIVFAPDNSVAAEFVTSSGPYISTITPGVSFLLNSVAGSSPAGGEIFNYVGYNP